MSKLTPSALRGLSVAAGTVGLAAVGAAAVAGQASAESGLPGLDSNGLPVSTNAVPAVMGAMAHNHGTIAGIPLSGLPVVGQLSGALASASPTSDALPGLGYADLGELPLTRSRPVPGAVGARARTVAPAHTAPAGVPAPAAPAAPALPPTAAPASQTPVAAPAAQVPNAQSGPLDNVTNALHGLPIAGQLAGPGQSLPVVGGLSGGLPLSGLGGLTGGLAGLGG